MSWANAGIISDDELEREEAEWPGHNTANTFGRKSGGQGKKSGAQHRQGSSRPRPNTPSPAAPSEPQSRLAESSPDVSEDESAMTTLNNLQGGDSGTSDLYHKYRQVVIYCILGTIPPKSLCCLVSSS